MLNSNAIPDLDAKGLRNFAFTFSVIISLLFGVMIPLILKHSFPVWPWVIAGVFVLWGVLIPNTLRPLYKIWMVFGVLMSKITTPLILGILFYVVISPVGIIFRLFKLDPMKRDIEKQTKTYRKLREVSIKTDFEKPY